MLETLFRLRRPQETSPWLRQGGCPAPGRDAQPGSPARQRRCAAGLAGRQAGRCLRQARGMAAYAWHMFAPALRAASALLPTCSPPLCAQRGLLRPRRNRVTTANFESADQSGIIWASPGTGLQLGWSGRAKKR